MNNDRYRCSALRICMSGNGVQYLGACIEPWIRSFQSTAIFLSKNSSQWRQTHHHAGEEMATFSKRSSGNVCHSLVLSSSAIFKSAIVVKSFTSGTALYCSTQPALPQYILTALYDRRIPERIVDEMVENPYLVDSLAKRFSKFEAFAQWMGKWGVRDGSDIGQMLLMRPQLLKANLRAMDETVTVYRKELQIPDDQVIFSICVIQ